MPIRRKTTAIAAAVFAVIAAGVIGAIYERDRSSPPEPACLRSSYGDPVELAAFARPGDAAARARFGDYDVRLYEGGGSEPEGAFEIMKGGRRVYAATGHRFKIGNIFDSTGRNLNEPALLTPGRDITGDGEPDLVISEWSGGAHGMFGFYIFQAGRTFCLLEWIDAADGNAYFRDIGGDGRVEVVIGDSAFDYWNECHAASPFPEVTLRWNGSRFALADDIQRRPRPSEEELRRLAARILAK